MACNKKCFASRSEAKNLKWLIPMAIHKIEFPEEKLSH